MKRFLLFAFVLVTLFSCRHTDNDPQAVGKAFTEAILKKDFAEAGKYASKESQPALEMLRSAENMYRQFGKADEFDVAKDLRGKKIEYTEPQMDGDSRATMTIVADGKEKMPLILVKEDKSWKVAFDKATIMDTERSNTIDKTYPVPGKSNEVTDSAVVDSAH